MSSTSTTWVTDSNTKSGTATSFTTTVSSLKLIGEEGEDAILKLFADEGDDNADQWRIVSSSSTNKLNFMTFASGAWSTVLDLYGAGGAVVFNEDSADIDFRVESNGNANMLFVDGGNDRVGIGTGSPSDNLEVSSSDPTIRLNDTNGYYATIAGSSGSIVLKADVGNATSGESIQLWTGAAQRMTIDGTGKVGIGTSSPDGQLHIVQTGENTGVTASTNANTLVLDSTDDPIGMSFLSQAGEKQCIYFGDVNDNDIGQINYDHADNDMDFVVNTTTVMRLDKNGNVGIGTEGAGFPLHIVGAKTTSATTTFSQLRIEDTSDFDGSPVAGISFSGRNIDGSTAAVALGAIHVKKLNSTTANESSVMEFLTRKEGSNPAVAMTLDEDGNVGIGTTSPGYELDVSGSSTPGIRVISTDGSAEVVIQSNAETNNSTLRFESGGDSDGRIYYDHHATQASQKMFFKTGDNTVDAMVIDGAGNVGVGTTAPAHKLVVSGNSATDFDALILRNANSTNGAASVLTFETSSGTEGDDAASAAHIKGIREDSGTDGALAISTTLAGTPAERMRITSDGNVGIGITSPSTELEVADLNSDAVIAISTFSGTDTHVPTLVLRKSSGSSVGTVTATADGEDLGIIRFYGTNNVTDNNAYALAANILCEQDAGAATTMTGRLLFQTYNAGSLVNAMTIRGSGRIGIGTSTPDELLDVSAHAATIAIASYDSDSITTNPSLKLRKSNSNTVGTLAATADNTELGVITFDGVVSGHGSYASSSYIMGRQMGGAGSSYVGGEIAFYTGTDSAAPTQKMTILDDGKVGIGIVTPATDLDIASNTPTITLTDLNATNDAYCTVGAGTGSLIFKADVDADIASETMQWWMSGSQKMTLLATGNLGIGETDPDELLHLKSSTDAKPYIKLEQAGNNVNSAGIEFLTSSTANDHDISGTLRFKGMNDAGTPEELEYATIYVTHSDISDGSEDSRMFFRTMQQGTLSQTMSIISGDVGINQTSPVSALTVVTPYGASASDAEVLHLQHTSTTDGNCLGIGVDFSAADPNDATQYFLYCQDSAEVRAVIRSNGGFANYQANDANLSDERLKEDIADAPDILSTLNSLKVRNFKYKDQTNDKVHTGLIAQEVESVISSIVDNSSDFKMIHTTDLYHMMLKAIQELSAKVEALENK